jgi:hypothetical protein
VREYGLNAKASEHYYYRISVEVEGLILLSCLGSQATTEVLKFRESRFLLALEVFDHISDGGEAVHSP